MKNKTHNLAKQMLSAVPVKLVDIEWGMVIIADVCYLVTIVKLKGKYLRFVVKILLDGYLVQKVKD
jgi:hypothetical protein